MSDLFSSKDSMAGDVNLFFNDEHEPQITEIEVMIAGNTCSY